MSPWVPLLKRMEDFVLAENGLVGAGYVRFEHNGREECGFPYIRSSHERFFQALNRSLELIARTGSRPRFLEVGCGLGTKCELARLCGFEAVGIDLDARYIALAQRLFPANCFIEANALEYLYGNQDLIYYHTPLANDSLMRELEKRILGTMSSGSLLCVTGLTETLMQNLTKADDSTTRWRKSLELVRFDDEDRLVGLRKTADIPDLDQLLGIE